MNFSNVVKVRMSELKVSKRELAESIGISYSYLMDIIKGRGRWNETTINKACEALKIEIEFKEVS